MIVKRLLKIKRKITGRDSRGQVSVRHRGGGEKRKLRTIDWKREKLGVSATVANIEYDPNRSAQIALLVYTDGEKRYIIAPVGLKLGDKVVASEEAEVKIGNRLPLSRIPAGTSIHGLELVPGKGAQLIRSAGSAATILSKEGKFAIVRFPSGVLRRMFVNTWATIGQVGNIEIKNRVIAKAGLKRHMGIRPTVRGVAMNPSSHPHGGGEGRSPIGMPGPKTPWGKPTLGKKTRRRKKWSSKFLMKGTNNVKVI